MVKLSGVLVKPEVTAYMYGTHALENTGQLSAALKSNSINLDAYVGKQVRITGKRVEGYPLEGGPDLIEVMDIEIINP